MVSRVPMLMIALALLALAPGARADDETDPYSRSGFYLGAGGVFASDIFEDELDDVIDDNFGPAVSVDVDPTWGIDARLGYRWGGWFATEIQYEYIDEFKADADAFGVPVGNATLSAHSATLNGRVILPIWRTQPYLLAGVGATYFELEDNTPGNLLGGSNNSLGFAGRVGGGIDFHLTQHLVLNAEATVLLTTQDFDAPVVGQIDDLYYLSTMVGLQYRF